MDELKPIPGDELKTERKVTRRQLWMGNCEGVLSLGCLYWILFIPDAHGLFPPLKFYRFDSLWKY